jgi:hypothetical protein
VKKQVALFLILLATLSVFVACKEKAKSVANGPSLCPSDSGMSETEAFICQLYQEFPPTQGAEDHNPPPEFQKYFVTDLREALGKVPSQNMILYDNRYSSLEYLSDFDLKFHERSGKLEVRYKEYDRPQEIDLVMRKQDGVWLISDIRYPNYRSSNSLRECLRPHIPDPTALQADYMTARRRYQRLSALDDGGWSCYPVDKQNALLAEKNKLLAFLNEHLKDIVGILEIEGFNRQEENNINSCVYDDNICENLDGARYTSENDGEIVITNKALLQKYVGADNRSLDPDRIVESDIFSQVLIQEANFIHMGDVAVEKPDSLDFLRVRFGYGTQDGTGAYPPGSAFFIATKGNLVFVGGLYFEEGTFPKIPLCAAGFKEGLEAQGFECQEEYYCGGQDSTNTLIFQAAEKTYSACYAEAMVNEPFYPKFLAKMQSIVDRIAAAH